jgi:DNA repair exonuclease SbcCD ATPase subunit
MGELQQEWEGIVQDGSWWKRRWEQLEMKPGHLQDLERRSLRLHAALEGTSERVELLRARLGELERLGGVTTAQSAVEGPLGEIDAVLRRIREARLARAREVLLSRASRYLGRISGGRILAVTWLDGSARLEGDSGPLAPLSEEDLAAGRLAVRLAGAALVAARGQTLASLVLEEPFDRLDVEASLRTLLLLRSLLDEIPRIVLVTRGDAVDARPELFDCVLEVRDDAGSGAAALRPAPAGAGYLVLQEPAGTSPARAQRS